MCLNQFEDHDTNDLLLNQSKQKIRSANYCKSIFISHFKYGTINGNYFINTISHIVLYQ